MTMKLICSVALIAAAACHTTAIATPGTCAGSQTQADIAVSVSIAPGPYKTNTPIPVEVTATNTGTSNISIPATMEPENDWVHFNVKDAQGKLLLYTGVEYKRMPEKNKVTLLPGYFWGKEFPDLREFYRLPGRGSYTVEVVYGISPLGECKFGSHRSNTVTFVVQ